MLMPAFKWNRVAGERFPAQAGESRARVGERVHANAEPRHAIAARNADQAECQNDDHLHGCQAAQKAEIEHDDRANEELQNQQKPALREQVGFAGFVDQLRDFQHGLMYRQVAQMRVHRQPEHKAQDTDPQANLKNCRALNAAHESSRVQVRELQFLFGRHQGRRSPLRLPRETAAGGGYADVIPPAGQTTTALTTRSIAFQKILSND